MNLEKIAWPVFSLGERSPLKDGTVIYFGSEYVNIDTGEYTANIQIVDDTSIDKPNLGRRRLELESAGVNLFPIKKAFYFLGDILKIAKPATTFIDSAGYTFNLTKTRRVKLVGYKIKKILPSTGLGAVVELEGLAQRFKTVFKPPDDAEYAAVLQLGLSYIFYGFYKDKPKNSWRKV